MKVKRAKTHKRSLAFYRHHFGLREPYQVLVDGTLVHAAVRYQIDLFEAMPRVLHAPVKLLVTPCVFAELEALNDRAFAPTLKVVRVACGAIIAVAACEDARCSPFLIAHRCASRWTADDATTRHHWLRVSVCRAWSVQTTSTGSWWPHRTRDSAQGFAPRSPQHR